MDDIKAWLMRLDLERYAQQFFDNEIDLDALPHITDEDLKDIGIALGARRKILAAAAPTASVTSTPAASVTPAPDAETNRTVDAERRQLTVMFCDLVGSTALSRALDPEDYRDLIRAYQDAVAGVITRYDGHIAKYMGDGVLAYFGFPTAHEDEAQRAAQAGLDILAAIKRIKADKHDALAVRIGVATGLVVVGDIIGDAGAREEAVVGETPNLAARLQTLAEPDQILFADSSRRLAGGMFTFTDLGSRELKGFELPEQVWRLDGERTDVNRFEATRDPLGASFVGREDELAALTRRWDLVKQGQGQIALISGEAGIGKSRLVETAARQFAGDGAVRLRYQCSPFHESSAYYPFVRQLTQAAGLNISAPADEALANLQQLFPSRGDVADKHVAAVAMMMSVPLNGAYEAVAPTPSTLKQTLFEALFGQLAALSAAQPVLITFEDLHWVDPSSQELLDMTLRRLEELPVLALLTFRPEYEPPWAGDANVASLPLNRLDASQTAALAAELAGSGLRANLLQEIVGRSDGIPLFAEELTRNLLEAQEDDSAASSIPATLQDILAARLDRLGDARETAQVGAVIGREFSHQLLAASDLVPNNRLPGDLSALEASGLLSRRGQAPDAVYTFKHALIQDAAYESLLRRRRQELHRRIAETIAGSFPDHAEQAPQVLAQHLEVAGDGAAAAGYWFQAGQRAYRLGAVGEAETAYRRALDVLALQEDPDAEAELQLDCSLALGPLLAFKLGPYAEELTPIYERTEVLSKIVGDDRKRYNVRWNAWHRFHFGGDAASGVEVAAELLDIGRRMNDRGMLLQAHHSGWTSHLALEDIPSTLSHAEAGRELYDPDEHKQQIDAFGGHDAGVCCRITIGMLYTIQGRLEEGRDAADEAVSLAERVEHFFSEIMARGFSCTSRFLRREPLAIIERVDALSERTNFNPQQFLHFTSTPLLTKGWALVQSGESEIGLELAQTSLDAIVETGFPRTSFQRYVLGDAYLSAGRLDKAEAMFESGLETAFATKERLWLPELYRCRAAVLARQGNSAAAETDYEQSMTNAREIDAGLFELRSARDLARLWAEQGRGGEALQLLQPAYDSVTQGRDTPDMVECRTLLDSLS